MPFLKKHHIVYWQLVVYYSTGLQNLQIDDCIGIWRAIVVGDILHLSTYSSSTINNVPICVMFLILNLDFFSLFLVLLLDLSVCVWQKLFCKKVLSTLKCWLAKGIFYLFQSNNAINWRLRYCSDKSFIGLSIELPWVLLRCRW